MKDLSIWTDGVETYIAHSAEEAERMRGPAHRLPYEPKPWRERTEERVRISPSGILDDETSITRPRAEWIIERGAGFLCTKRWLGAAWKPSMANAS